jgi:hypothetical protein
LAFNFFPLPFFLSCLRSPLSRFPGIYDVVYLLPLARNWTTVQFRVAAKLVPFNTALDRTVWWLDSVKLMSGLSALTAMHHSALCLRDEYRGN